MFFFTYSVVVFDLMYESVYTSLGIQYFSYYKNNLGDKNVMSSEVDAKR